MMMFLRWFGGLVPQPQRPARAPAGSRAVAGGAAPVWAVGAWADSEIRTALAGDRSVMVFGRSLASSKEISRWARWGVPMDTVAAVAGSHTIVEITSSRVVVFTDLAHAQPIYLARTGQGVVWGSSSLALASLIGTGPNPDWLATSLRAPHHRILTEGLSAFTGVRTIPPGSRLVLEPGRPPHVTAVWQPEPAGLGLAEGARRLRLALAEAVATVAAGADRVAVDCSGGMDSTSLTLLAAANPTPGKPLVALTVHPEGTIAGGDLGYARMAVAARDEIEHVLCPLSAGHAPYSRMRELPSATDEPAPTTIAISRLTAELHLLGHVAAGCLMTGDGGDTLLGGHPAYLADLVRQGAMGTLFWHATGWARLRRTSVWPLLANAVTRARTAALEDNHGIGVGARLTLEAIRVVARTARADAQIAEQHGIRLHNPFTDPQVVAAALAVPACERAGPFDYKPLLAAAMDGVLPPCIAGRRTKGDFTPDQYLGLRQNLPSLQELADGRLAALGLVDPAALRRSLCKAAAGLPVVFSSLNPLLAAEVWLRSLDAAPPAAQWAPVEPAAGTVSP